MQITKSINSVLYILGFKSPKFLMHQALLNDMLSISVKKIEINNLIYNERIKINSKNTLHSRSILSAVLIQVMLVSSQFALSFHRHKVASCYVDKLQRQ